MAVIRSRVGVAGLADTCVALAASVNSEISVLKSRMGQSTNTFGKLAGREQKLAVHIGRRWEAVPSRCVEDVW